MPLALEIAEYAAALWCKRTDLVHFLDPRLAPDPSIPPFGKHSPQSRSPAPLASSSIRGLLRPLAIFGLRRGSKCSPPTSPNWRRLTSANLYNLILTNPPYVRHHHLERTAKKRLRADVAGSLSIDISGLAGLYCYFLLLADAWLAPRGLAIWLIPSEFMDVNYGEAVKRYLTERVKLLHIHRFCPMDVQFSGALVSSAIVVFEKTPPPKRHSVMFTHGGSLQKPTLKQRVPLCALCDVHKWTVYPTENGAIFEPTNGDIITLADLFDIKRGLATGATTFLFFHVAR